MLEEALAGPLSRDILCPRSSPGTMPTWTGSASPELRSGIQSSVVLYAQIGAEQHYKARQDTCGGICCCPERAAPMVPVMQSQPAALHATRAARKTPSLPRGCGESKGGRVLPGRGKRGACLEILSWGNPPGERLLPQQGQSLTSRPASPLSQSPPRSHSTPQTAQGQLCLGLQRGTFGDLGSLAGKQCLFPNCFSLPAVPGPPLVSLFLPRLLGCHFWPLPSAGTSCARSPRACILPPPCTRGTVPAGPRQCHSRQGWCNFSSPPPSCPFFSASPSAPVSSQPSQA